jgi:hypothetical protein
MSEGSEENCPSKKYKKDDLNIELPKNFDYSLEELDISFLENATRLNVEQK